MSFVCHYPSPLGSLTLVSDAEFLTGLFFDDQKQAFDNLLVECDDKLLPIFEKTYSWLDRYFSGVNPGQVPPIRFSGSLFQVMVWKILQQIPYGCVMTYGQIARIIAAQKHILKMSAQAIGGAVGHNPVSLIVPCHRVVGAYGSLTGYAGGLDRKEKLLRIEGIDLKRFDEFLYRKE